MRQNRAGGIALALSAITLVVVSATWVSEGEARPAALPIEGLPAGGLPIAAQLTPGAATPAPTAAAVLSPTLPAPATATSAAAASPTSAATLAATATSPAVGAATAVVTTAVAVTATATDVASPVATAAAPGTATSAATSTASPAATVAATGTATRAATATPPPTPTVPLATSTAVIIVTPQPALAPSTTALDTYMTGVAPQYQYYNGPNATYPTEWYLQRHLSNPAQFTMYRTEPLGLCTTSYYPYHDVYYGYTGCVAAAMPDYVAPGMAVIPPSVLGPGAVPPGMAVGVVPGMVGGVVQTGTGYAVQSAWANVAPAQQYYYGPNYVYDDDWYYARHISNPSLYRVYSYDPGPQCVSYYYRWQNQFMCYTGGSVGASAAMLAPPPPGVMVDPAAMYSMQAYWGQVDPSYWYYYGPDYGYDDAWYAQRHLANPLLYTTYPFDPGPRCGSYAYQYRGRYYCYTGAYTDASSPAAGATRVR